MPKNALIISFCFNHFFMKSNLIIELLEMYEFKNLIRWLKKGHSNERLHLISENYENRQ